MKPLKWTIILLCLLTSYSIDAGWHFVSPMPHGRYGHDAVLGPDGKIYVMGGIVVDILEDDNMGRKHSTIKGDAGKKIS